MLTYNRLEAGGSKLEAWLTEPDFFSLEPQASCLKLISALADGGHSQSDYAGQGKSRI